MMQVDGNLSPWEIELELTSSRKTLELGEPSEILLHIRNHSRVTVWITDLTTMLTLPAEVVHPGQARVASRAFKFPTVQGTTGTDVICIPAGGRYMCCARLNSDVRALDAKVCRWDRIRWHMFFHPARYEFQANVHVWTRLPDGMKVLEPKVIEDYLKTLHNEPEEVRKLAQESLHVAKQVQAEEMSDSLPLTVTGSIEVSIKATSQFAAAAVGGGLAFLFRELYDYAFNTQTFILRELWLLPAYVLVAVLVSLMISRITEARFPLTVRIMDFWGATAVGVLAAFSGDAILSKIVALLAK